MSIISLAKSLNFDVIAEGEERNHQLLKIQELNCQFGQGFLFSEPLDQGAIDAWVKAENFQNVNRRYHKV